MLASDGRCKTVSADADGYGRGEGAVIVVLKRLADAVRAVDRIHAVILGSAVNHNGQSNGIAAPSTPAQEALIRQALADSGVDAATVDFVEAHGTGTLLGDPRSEEHTSELQSLMRISYAVFCLKKKKIKKTKTQSSKNTIA